MHEHITEYVRSCDVCQRNKVIRHTKYGLLEPLEVPMRPWTAISMDFIVGVPKSEGYTKIWVIVDRFSKMAHFIPLKTEEHIKVLALAFVKEIWRLHGLPESIVSDRDTRFTSKFWTTLMQLLQHQQKITLRQIRRRCVLCVLSCVLCVPCALCVLSCVPCVLCVLSCVLCVPCALCVPSCVPCVLCVLSCMSTPAQIPCVLSFLATPAHIPCHPGRSELLCVRMGGCLIAVS